MTLWSRNVDEMAPTSRGCGGAGGEGRGLLLNESKQVLKLFVASHNYTLVMEEAEQLPIFRPIMPRNPKPLPTWDYVDQS